MKNKKALYTILLVFFLAVIGVCGFYIANTVITRKNNDKVYEKLKDAKETTKETETETVKQTETEVEKTTKKDEKNPIDFNKLWDINEDIYAWITIPNTNIDYPVLQHPFKDNYYLNVTVDGKKGFPGSIYTQVSYNTMKFDDFNTIVYGHNMRNDTYFTQLVDYKDEDYFKKHQEVTIYLPEKVLKYKIAAAVVFSDDLIPYKYNRFRKESDKEAFIYDVYNSKDKRCVFDKNIKLTAKDKLLTLSTCISDEKEHRFLVIGVLEDSDKQ